METRPDTTAAALASCAAEATKKALKSSKADVLKPMMLLCVQTPSQHVGSVVADLSGHRHGIIRSVESSEGVNEVTAEVFIHAIRDLSLRCRCQRLCRILRVSAL